MESNNNQSNQASEVNPVLAFCAFLALVISAIAGFNMEIKDPGFFKRAAVVIAAVIGGVPGGLIGAAIGDVLRRAACPDAIFTSGGMGAILKQKIFWAIGPQTIGLAIGLFIGIRLTAGMLIKYCFS